jgi:plastocyanin
MNRRLTQITRFLSISSVLALGIVGAPAVSAGNPCFHDFTMPPASAGTGNEIKLMPCAFEPTVTQVAVGAEVTFFNGPDFSHLITGANQEWGSPDVELQPGRTISYTFDKAGVYPYACVLHPGMSGAIVVGDLAVALAAGSMTGASTTGGATGGSVGATEPVAQSSASADSTNGNLVFVALGVGAGLVAGAAAVWLAIRRRPERETLARAD